MSMRITLEDRFWSKVNKNGPIIRPELGPCWIWIGCCNSDGYGKIWNNGTSISAHIISWQLAGHELPDEADVCHECDNRPCIRPDHLFLGTKLTNAQDRDEKGRCGNRNGEYNGNHKLTEVQVLEIRQLLYGFHSKNCVEIARIYGIHESTVWFIKNMRHWQYLP